MSFWISPAARSAEIYVHWDPRYGNDATGNGSEAFPFRTITRAHQAARATDILRFAGGTYSERTRLEKSVRLTRVGGIAKLGQATLPTIPYTTFDGRLVTRALVKGQKVALLPSDPTLHPPTLDRIASALDRAYDAYLAAAGRPPQPYRMIQGLLPIAAVDQTCGAGCGYLESTGIELQQATFDRLYNGALFRDQYDQTPFYELGRNFWLYESKIAYRESTATPIGTGFAVFMRFYSMEAAGVAGGPINGVEFGVFKSAIEALVDDYLKSPSYQWGNTLAVNRAPTNPYQLNGTDLFASFLFRLRRDFGGNEFIQRLWRAVDARPVATNTQGAIDNFVVAASLAAQQNLISLFRQTWRWPVSQAADIELGRLCPACENSNQKLVVSAGADQVVNGNPSAAPVAATLTAVVTRGGTPTSAAIRWEQVSGPCRSTIDSPTSQRTTVRMPCLGTFTFRVSATQGSETATDALLVTVRWDGVNAAPVITMPTRLVVFGTPIGLSGIDACAVLSASVVDDGQPNPPGKVTTRWSRVTGPAGVTFETPLSATTRACFSGIGTYVLRLVATDGDPSGNPAGLTTSKDIEVVVELHAKHYLKSVVTPVNCGVQSFGPGLQNTHGSRSIRATIEVTTITGQVPVPQVTIRTVTIAARQTWAAPCSSTLRLLSASYVDPFSSTSASDRSLAMVKSSARLQWHPEIRSSLNQGLVELELTGTPGQLYRIEVSDDLNHWQPVMEWRATGGADQMRDQAPEGATARYYRVIESQESTDADVRSVEPTRE